jgi:hypothetical protein
MINISQVLIGLEEQMRSGMPVRFALELAFIKLTALPGASDIGDLVKKLEAAGTAPEKAPAASDAKKAESKASASAGKAKASKTAAKRSAPHERTLAGAAVMNRTDAPVLEPPPKVVKTELGIPDAPPKAPAQARNVDARGSHAEPEDDFVVSEDDADFETGEAAVDDGTAVDVTVTGEPEIAPPPISMGDPRAWLREQLARDPSLAEMVERIKKAFGATEIALDGIPFG